MKIKKFENFINEDVNNNNLVVTNIRKQPHGAGHNKVYITVTGELKDEDGTKNVEDYELNCVTNNTMATDAYFDDVYDEDLTNIDSFYETRYDAAESLIDEVFRVNDIISDYEIDIYGLLTTTEVKELRIEVKELRERE
ncbi:MAG: hypothetical protein M0R46_17565 [Candidatus Muirbacterium halophilum]|nr:hypothetical protein [Candidatus Muirbacterium halophilum]